MKNLRILIFKSFFLNLAFPGKGRQHISSSISFSLMIIYLEVVLREFLYPVDLTKTETFCIHKLVEVIIVSKDKDLVFVAFQIVAPSFESLNDG